MQSEVNLGIIGMQYLIFNDLERTLNVFLTLFLSILSFLPGLGATTGQILIVKNNTIAVIIGFNMFGIGGLWLNKYLKGKTISD